MAFGDIRSSGEIVVVQETGVNDTTIDPTFTAAAQENDLIVLIASANEGINTPTGFTSDATLSVTDGTDEFRLFWKVAGGSEPDTYEVDTDTATLEKALIGVIFEGPFDASPVDVAVVGNKETGSGSLECPHNTGAPTYKTFTTTTADTVILGVAFGRLLSSFTNYAMDGGAGNSFTYGDEARGIPSAETSACAFCYRVVSSTGTYTTRLQAVFSAAQPYHYGSMIAFKQASAGSPADEIAEDIELSDTFAGRATTGAALVEGFGLADASGSLAAAQDALSETLGLDGQTQALAVALASLTEAMSIGETWAGEVNSTGEVGQISEATELSDIFVAAVQAYAAASQGVALGDAWSATAAARGDIYDASAGGVSGSVELTAVLDAISAAGASLVEGHELDDAWSAMSVALAAIGASVAFSDSWLGVVAATDTGEILDAIGLSESVSGLVVSLSSLSESFALAAQMAPAAAALAAVSAGLSLGATFSASDSASVAVVIAARTAYVRSDAGKKFILH